MIKIRYAKISDVEAMVDVNIKTWITTYSGIIDRDFLYEGEKNREQVINNSIKNFRKSQVKGRRVYQCLAAHGEDIVGIATYGKCRGQEYGFANLGEIYSIYILKEYQGRGIGKKLLKFAAEDLIDEDYDKLIIWSLKDNPSIGFYKNLGFERSLSKRITIGNQDLEEIGFVYDIKTLLIRSS